MPFALPVVAVDAVHDLDDRLACVPYAAKVTARACLARQAAARPSALPIRNGEALRIDARVKLGDLAKCRGCADGVVVARAFGARPLEAPAPKAPASRPAVAKEEVMAPPALPTPPEPAPSCTAISSRQTRFSSLGPDHYICGRCLRPGHNARTCRRTLVPVPEPVLQALAARFEEPPRSRASGASTSWSWPTSTSASTRGHHEETEHRNHPHGAAARAQPRAGRRPPR